MKIPSRLRLMGQTITITFVDNLVYQTDNTGQALFRENLIELQSRTDSIEISYEKIEHNFYHELVHHILNKLCEVELRDNEKFVDTFAGLLHQALTSMEYENTD